VFVLVVVVVVDDVVVDDMNLAASVSHQHVTLFSLFFWWGFASQDPRALLACVFALEVALPPAWLAQW
jgi:hypothetical protein